MKKEQLLRLAEANDPQGLYGLGILFLNGKTVRKDPKRGMAMIQKAAGLGHHEAIELLDHMAMQQAVENNKTMILNHFNMKEIKRVPSLTTVNSIGFKLLGRSNYDPDTDSFESTHFFVFWWVVPLIPTARYRVIKNDNIYSFMGKVPLRPLDWIPAVFFALFILSSLLQTGSRLQ